MSAMIAHSIIRYRMMDITVVIKKGVVYVCAIVTAASVFILLLELLKRLAGYQRDTLPAIEALLVALALAIVFQPLKDWIERSFNRYLYRETYDYPRTIRDASRQLSTMLDLDPLLDYLTTVIGETFKGESVTVYLQDPSGGGFGARTSKATGGWQATILPIALSETSPILDCLHHNQKTLIREEARRDLHDDRLVLAAQQLQDLSADIAFPLTNDLTLVGIILVGRKRSGDPYFAEDIDLLETLVGQATVAMKNAQLYRQVVLVNEYLDNILSTMQNGVIAVNAAGHISLFNLGAERLTGLRASEIQGGAYQRLPGALASPLRDALDAHIPRPEFETSMQNADNVNVPLMCSTALLRHKGSTAHGALIVFSDLTRQKDLERENRRAERLASFGALASGGAHEIKNPLVAIRTFAELLPERFTDVDFREDFSKVVIREIVRIDDLVGRLRGIASTTPQQAGTVDIREPITDTLLLLRAQLEQTRTIVRCDFQDPAPFVAVEEAQLKQLFLNLLLNSIEAMVSGGEITVRLARKDLHGSPWIVVEVSDSGPGIPESVRGSVFDPFFTTKPRGTGLGLAICRGITDAHRGTIRAENRTDRSGTIFTVEFPVSSEAPSLAEEKALHS